MSVSIHFVPDCCCDRTPNWTQAALYSAKPRSSYRENVSNVECNFNTSFIYLFIWKNRQILGKLIWFVSAVNVLVIQNVGLLNGRYWIVQLELVFTFLILIVRYCVLEYILFILVFQEFSNSYFTLWNVGVYVTVFLLGRFMLYCSYVSIVYVCHMFWWWF